MNKKTARERLNKYYKIFNDIFDDLVDGEDINYDAVCFDEKLMLYQMFMACNIKLNDNNVIEAEETSYDVDRRLLKINLNDDIEYVDYVIMNKVFERILDEVPLPTMKLKVTGLFIIFTKLGLMRGYTNRFFKGSDHIILSTFTKIFIQLNE